MIQPNKMTTAAAVSCLRSDSRYADLIRDSYLDRDVLAAAQRFYESAEFREVCQLLGGQINGARILDLGAGTGIASYAFARAGAHVYALEPDDSDIGRGAISQIVNGMPVELLDAFGEAIPLPDQSLDIIYGRQVLHHTRDLHRVMQQCERVLKPGGMVLICREHVVDDEQQLNQFLHEHPVHKLAGGEHAYSLDTYQQAISGAGLRLTKVLGPWDSIINAFPKARNNEELSRLPEQLLAERFSHLATLIRFIPGIHSLTWRRIRANREPGRLYSFLAIKV
ncbi:MAG TPA: class I SAM-dependent methyltransferase [Pyrinomonadaceae bacterium]|nr:class I SAM-dependent methyltransferase [Pyrinomonadaceae bacterium]